MNKQKAHIQQKVATMNLNDSTVLLMIKGQCWEQLGLLSKYDAGLYTD